MIAALLVCAHASAAPGTVRLVVVDQDHFAAAGMKVTVVGGGSVWTDRFGQARLVLPPGRWTVAIRAPDGELVARFDEVVRDGEATREDVALVGYVARTAVTEVAPASWDRDAIVRLPSGRSIDALLAMTPGVTRGPSGLSVEGSPPSEVEWLLDGVAVTDPVTGGDSPTRARTWSAEINPRR